MTKWLPRVATI